MAKISRKKRTEITARAKGLCEYCRSNSTFSESPFEIEHILPRTRGGQDTDENTAFACRGCNIHKRDYVEGLDFLSGKIVRLFDPRNDNWYEHFSWSDDFTLMVGLTAVGRATIDLLRLNREGLINQRTILYAYGEHPAE
jgi:hypothetical protein